MSLEEADAPASAFLVSTGDATSRRIGVETERGVALARFAESVRSSQTRAGLLSAVATEVRGIFHADGVVLFERDPGDARVAFASASAGTLATPETGRFSLADGWVGEALTHGEFVRIESLAPAPEDEGLRRAGVEAALIAPVLSSGRADVALAVVYAAPRRFDEVDLVALRGIAMQVELALESRRLADADRLRGRRNDSLERTMLALREPREALDILAIVARGLAHDFGRPCVAYEARDGRFVPVVGSGTTGPREWLELDRFEAELLAGGNVRRDRARDVTGVTANDQLRALLILEEAREPLSEDDTKYLRAVSTHAGLALSAALAFDRLRRYAAEGAALEEAARTMLGFTELRPLAVALARLAVRLVRAERAEIYAIESEELVLLGACGIVRPDEPPAADDAPSPGSLGLAAFERRYGSQPFVAAPLRLTGGGRGGFLVVRRPSGAPFERYERRIVDALVNLAQLAIRNVDLYERSDRANRALAESNGFKDDLLAMFAHDFKGPLTVISGFSELLLEIAEDEEIRGNVRTISEQTKRLAKLAEDALALAATQSAGFSLRRELDDLGGFARECATVLDVDGSRIAFELPEAPVELLFDRNRLRHVVDNVVGNALKYSSGPVLVRVGRGARTAFVEVSDRGIGVPALELATIFTRYGRASNARSRGVSGSGVGLYIAKKIVDVHGGTLTVTSVENEGSTFRIELPVAAVPAPAALGGTASPRERL